MTSAPDPHPEVSRTAGRLTNTGIMGVNFTPEERARRQDMALEALRIHGTIRQACAAAGVNRKTVTERWMEDPEFKTRWEDALEDYNDRLRDEVTRRAVDGTVRVKKVFFQGQLVDQWEEREYSDSLLMFQMKARMPEYRENRTEDSGAKIPVEALWQILERVEQGKLSLPAPAPGAVDGEFTAIDG